MDISLRAQQSPLTSVFYVSRAQVEADGIKRIVEASRETNAARGLTGGMLYTGEFFAQVLEGPPAAVSERWEVISADPRHDLVKSLDTRPIANRHYSRWTMGYIHATAANALIAQLLQGSIDPGKATRLRDLLLEWISGGV